MKKKILFEVDIKDWAFYFMVKSWSEKLVDEYDCYYVCNDIYRIKELPKMSRIKIDILNTIATIRFTLYKIFSKQNFKSNSLTPPHLPERQYEHENGHPLVVST